jgi:uncharacterized lipoprotein YmbA
MKLTVIIVALLMAGCTTPAIVGEQLNLNAAELLDVNDKLRSDCRIVTTVTQTPSSWWSWIAPVRQVTSTVECKT